MKVYKSIITLNKNSRGCYIFDTIKGCGTCLKTNKKGCYGECYARKIANRYGFDFSQSVSRNFKFNENQLWLFGLKDNTHKNIIIKQIKSINMPFIRIGEMGDPSENWDHTINICKEISITNKPIVIITKHWKKLSENNLSDIKKMNIYINTSISALDSSEQIDYRLSQFYRLKNICQSILRIVSCDFNKVTFEGLKYSIIQDKLFKHSKNIDTIFRPSKENPLVIKNIINVKMVKFLNSFCLASIFNKKTYFGSCNKCPDMCGIFKK